MAARSPFLERYVWHVDGVVLDITKMKRAAALLSGRHNFEWMSLAQEGELRNPVRELHLSIELVDPGPFATANTNGPQNLIKITGQCDFFLYRMMRRIVGILVNIATGRIDEMSLKTCLAENDGAGLGGKGAPMRQRNSSDIPATLLQTAPAKGLCLEHIEYQAPIW